MTRKTSGVQVLVTCSSRTLDKRLIHRHLLPTPTPQCRKNTLVWGEDTGPRCWWLALRRVGLTSPLREEQSFSTHHSSGFLCWSWRGLARPQGWAVTSQLHRQPTSRQIIRPHGPQHSPRGEVTCNSGLVKGSDHLPNEKVPGQARPPASWEPALGLRSHPARCLTLAPAWALGPRPWYLAPLQTLRPFAGAFTKG